MADQSHGAFPDRPPRASSPSKTRKSEADSSPQPKQQVITTRQRTELPHEPEHVYHAFEISKVEQAPVGNPDMIVELKVNGQLGVFYDRANANRRPIPVMLNATAYHTAISHVLKLAIERLLFLKDHIDSTDIDTQSTHYADILADGVLICTYTKLRNVNSLNPTFLTTFRTKPRAPTSLEVPVPYALAISQLGQIRVSGLAQEKIFTPAMTTEHAATFGLPTPRKWSAANYGRAVEYATKLGMHFSHADLNVKLGSSWWLYRPVQTDGRFTLQCPIPEENFTPTMAVLASLFCCDAYEEPLNPIFNLDPVGTDNFGTMLRDPHDLIALSTFFAVEGDPSVVWKIA